MLLGVPIPAVLLAPIDGLMPTRVVVGDNQSASPVATLACLCLGPCLRGRWKKPARCAPAEKI
eukprot:8105360-Pyramimonas_sp.AAC.1